MYHDRSEPGQNVEIVDKPKQIVKPFIDVLKTIRALALIDDQDVQTLLYLLSVLERPVLDIRAEMEEQPRLLITVGYYYRSVQQRAKEQEDEVQKALMRVYSATHKLKYQTAKTPKAKDPIGRFSDKVVLAQALQDPTFVCQSDSLTQLKALTEFMSELRTAFQARTRFLDQISNHERFTIKQEQLEDSLQ